MKRPEEESAALCQLKTMPRRGDALPPPDSKGLLAVCLAVLLMAFLASGHRACPNESITRLARIIQLLGNSSDAQLYTPEDFTEDCYASNLECFRLELQVIMAEEEEHRDILSRLNTGLANLKPRKNCTDPHAQCPPCECHPEQAVPVFLSTLRQMLQWSCMNQIVPCAAKKRKTCWPPPQ